MEAEGRSVVVCGSKSLSEGDESPARETSSDAAPEPLAGDVADAAAPPAMLGSESEIASVCDDGDSKSAARFCEIALQNNVQEGIPDGRATWRTEIERSDARQLSLQTRGDQKSQTLQTATHITFCLIFRISTGEHTQMN